MLYELRIYHCMPGKLPAVVARFETATVKLFEKHYPSIHITVRNVGAGTPEYTKLLTVLKAGSGAPDVVQIEFERLPEFIATGDLRDLAPWGQLPARSG